jgi:hypothetical protein
MLPSDPDRLFWALVAPVVTIAVTTAFVLLGGGGRLALASGLLSLAVVEISSSAALAWREPKVEMWLEPEYYQAHPFLGWAPKPGITSRAWKRMDGQTIYDVVYEIDAHGRRVTPLETPGPRPRFLLFFGGAFAFGEGVTADETLPYQTARRLPDHTPYNYGFHGYGPQHLLARLEAGGVREQVAEDQGSLVYVFIDSHVNRAVGSLVVYSGWADTAPHYELTRDGTPIRRGSFTTGRFWTSLLYNALGRSAAVRLFRIEHPFAIGEPQVEFAARLFARAQELFQDEFGAQRFAVLLFPGSELAAPMRAALARHGVESLDYSALLDFQEPDHHLPVDRHPSALAYRRIAGRLGRDLRVKRRPPAAEAVRPGTGVAEAVLTARVFP